MLSRFRFFAALGMSLSLLLASVPVVHAATGDITAVRITPDGWYAEVDIDGLAAGGTYAYGLSPTFDPTSARMVFTVTSEGYTSSGAPTTITRTVYGVETLRKPYPNQTQKAESVSGGTLTVKVALSDFIYNDDKNGGVGTSGTDVRVSIASGWYTQGSATAAVSNMTVTNNSTLDYPKVIGRWAWPGYERVTGDFTAEAVLFHRFAQYGKPVAAVKFYAEDEAGNNAATQTVTDLRITSPSNDANPVPVYAATIPVTNLNQSDVIEVNFKAYPWVGDEDSVLDSTIGKDGVAQPEERLGPLYAVNDKQGTYGVAYALVSPTGSDTTGQAYGSQAAAEAGSPFKSVSKAADAIKSFNTANYGRSDAGGGVVLLTEGTHAFPGITTTNDLGAMDTWLTVRPASNATKANTIIGNGTNTIFKATRLKIEGLSFAVPSTMTSTVLRGRTATDALWLHNNAISFAPAGSVHTWKTLYSTQNTITAWNGGMKQFSSYKAPYALVRGNASTPVLNATLYAVLGNKNVTANPFTEDDSTIHKQSDNAVYAFNTVYAYNSYNPIAGRSDTLHGIAIVQNVMESLSTSQPLLQVSADSNVATTTNNVILWHNTLTGQRLNVAYNETGTVSRDRLNWSQRFNSLKDWNNKDDTFGTQNGNRVGSWPVGYNVGTIANRSQMANFPGEFGGLFSDYSNVPAYTSDKSVYGAGGGNGDYTLTASSENINAVPAAFSPFAVLPFDILGNLRDSQPDAGAYEYGAVGAPAAPAITFIASPATVTQGSNSMLSWSASNATSCTASGGWTGVKPISGFETIGPLATTQTYTISCSGAGGSALQTATVSAVPPASPSLLGAQVRVNGNAVGSEIDLSSLGYTWDTIFGTTPPAFTSTLRFSSGSTTTSQPWQF